MSSTTSTNSFLYGYIGGMMGVVASHPIDTIKTNIQKGQPVFIHQLYRGMLPPLFGVGLEKSIVFGVYETTRPYTNSDIISGALAGSCASFVVTPFERLKILLQTGQTFTHRNLFQGLSATFSRETPGFSIYFYTYNKLKQERRLSPFHNFVNGALSGIASWVFIYPQDRIKTCIQSSRDTNISFIKAVRMVHNEKGLTSFYKGFHYALLRAIPLHATAFMTVEYCKTYLEK